MLHVHLKQINEPMQRDVALHRCCLDVINDDLPNLPTFMSFDAEVPAGSESGRFAIVGDVDAAFALAMKHVEDRAHRSNWIAQIRAKSGGKRAGRRYRRRAVDELEKLRTVIAAVSRGACKVEYAESQETYVVYRSLEDAMAEEDEE